MKKIWTALVAVAFAATSNSVYALTITDLYGDMDGFGFGLTDGDSFSPSTIVTELDDEGITDRGLYGTQSWMHTYDISGLGTITSASIEVLIGGLGAYGGAGSLYVDNQFVGLLTDGDTCGDPIGCTNTAELNTFDLMGYSSYLDGATSISVGYTYSGDFWALDYSLLTISDNGANPVPEPATMILFGTGLAGLAGLKRKKKD